LPVAAPAADPDGSASARPEEVEFDPPVVTPTLLIATVLWFFVGLVYAARVGVPVGEYLWSGNAAVLERLGAVTGPNLLRGEWWRLLSNCLVHVGAVHLVLNMFVLGTAGPLAELFWGRGRLALVYVFSGLAGSCLAMALRPLADSG